MSQFPAQTEVRDHGSYGCIGHGGEEDIVGLDVTMNCGTSTGLSKYEHMQG